MRFLTVPDTKSARKSVFVVTRFIGFFFLVIVSKNPAFRETGIASGEHTGGMTMPVGHVGRDLILGVFSATAFTTILAVDAGRTMVVTSVISHAFYLMAFRKNSPIRRRKSGCRNSHQPHRDIDSGRGPAYPFQGAKDFLSASKNSSCVITDSDSRLLLSCCAGWLQFSCPRIGGLLIATCWSAAEAHEPVFAKVRGPPSFVLFPTSIYRFWAPPTSGHPLVLGPLNPVADVVIRAVAASLALAVTACQELMRWSPPPDERYACRVFHFWRQSWST